MSPEPVQFGLYLPQVALGYDEIIARALVAEELGFHSLWLYDHLYAPGLPGRDSFEAWTLASFVLAQTTRLRVGHLVLCCNFRHPALLAKMATTLDVLSGGRLELGLGSGSVGEEHHRAGLPWGSAGDRSERLGETLQIVSDMFGARPTSFSGRHYRVADLPNLPPPHQKPGPPIHVGGIGRRRTLPLVARFADVWNVPTYGLGQWPERRRLLEAECEAIGRDPATVRTSLEAVLVLVEEERDLPEARARAERRYGAPGFGLAEGGFVGTPAMVVERIAAAAAAGVTLIVFITSDRGDPETLRLFAERVLPAFT